MVIWMKVTNDEFELPVAIADSAPLLAEMIGTTAASVRSSVSHFKSGRNKRSLYRKVEVTEDDE